MTDENVYRLLNKLKDLGVWRDAMFLPAGNIVVYTEHGPIDMKLSELVELSNG